MTGLLSATNLRLRRGEFTLVVDRLDLCAGEVLGLVGPNGAGKSTLLELLALLTPPDSGALQWSGREVTASERHLEVRREASLVSQRPLLLSGTVEFNLRCPLQLRGVSAADQNRRVEQMVATFSLEPLLRRDATKLSGGETRRVALARALITKPRLLLLDEPTAELDWEAREQWLAELQRVIREPHRAVVLATHEPSELLQLATSLATITSGTYRHLGSLDQLDPTNCDAWTARFLRRVGSLPLNSNPNRTTAPT